MPKSLTRTQDTLSPSLLAFKPRQVLLASRNLQMKPNTLSPDQKAPLLYAVARFLEGNGFSKTLKNFLSDAPIEKNGMKDSSLDLGEMYGKYSEMCDKNNTSVNNQKETGNDPAPEKIANSKDKKTNRKTSELPDQGDKQLCIKELKKPEQVDEADKSKEKKKKKGKVVPDVHDVEQSKVEPLSGEIAESLKAHTYVKEKGVTDSETVKKSKDKKKTKSKSNDDSVSPNVEQGGVEAKQDGNGTIETLADENVVDVKPKVKKNKEGAGCEDKKMIRRSKAPKKKKKKRSDSEGNPSEPVKSKEDENAENSSIKSVKKQRNDSTEPKTIKAFQRVKVEEDGAEIGYGAKAQEILGQVKGRDSRREKTKKKRGSYRGQIDLQSHSVKFSYSDED